MRIYILFEKTDLRQAERYGKAFPDKGNEMNYGSEARIYWNSSFSSKSSVPLLTLCMFHQFFFFLVHFP